MSPAVATPAVPAVTCLQAGTAALAEMVSRSSRQGPVVVLSGAGLSTESGIPDYRGPAGSLRRHTPMTYQEFVSGPEAQRRYWARSHVGWPLVVRAAPNEGHRAVAGLQDVGVVGGVVTQNVDGLHQAGGARDVVELHGGLDRVICLRCEAVVSRDWLDGALCEANPDFAARRLRLEAARAGEANPDGDVDLAGAVVDGFRLVPCPVCRGPLKPDVVFFGESVPKPRVERCFDLVARAGLLLVLGSSLAVMSGYRFVRRAHHDGIPVAIVNQGPTRGDGEASLRVDAPLGQVMPALLATLRAA